LDWRAKKLKEFIDQQQGRVRWRLGDACMQLGFPMSDRQARRLFKVSIGVGIKEYSMNRRLACAAQQLRATNAPIKAIALDVGYQTTVTSLELQGTVLPYSHRIQKNLPPEGDSSLKC